LTVYSLLKSLALPPVSLFVLIGLGVLWWRRPLLGRGLVVLSTLLLLVLSLPIVSHRLMEPLEPYPALGETDLQRPTAQAIVVLGANRYTDATEYGGDSVGSISLQRVRYAAWLQRRTGLPLIVSGGSPPHEDPPLGRLMARVLEQEFQVPVQAVEDGSQTTWENAALTAPLLRKLGLERIFLVTSAWHLPRAVRAFEQNGLRVTPAPTAFETRTAVDGPVPQDFLPGPDSLHRSYYAIHEYLGRLWYRIKEWVY
jgi:uncharacterized SAM-binding protein YcdF (DUF218 family)